MMPKLPAIIFFLFTGQLCYSFQSIDRDKSIEVFSKTFKIFENKIQPYLIDFAEKQYAPNTEGFDQVSEAQYHIFKQKLETLRKESFDYFFKNHDSKKNYRSQYWDYFDSLIRNNFPGIDYKYFEEVRKECEYEGLL